MVPFLKVVNDTAVAVNQGGKRKGAVCAYLETWHLDIEEFLELRKNTGDDRRRTHDMNTANWIPDLFMHRVMEKGNWTLFSPAERARTCTTCSARSSRRPTSLTKTRPRAARSSRPARCRRRDLWRKMLAMLFETGHPWITFKDACNVRSPQQHVGVVHSSNLCTEITLNTSDTEIAVCNLGLGQPVVAAPEAGRRHGVDHDEAARARSRAAMRMLDNVIDINYYAVKKARNSEPEPPPGRHGHHGLPGLRCTSCACRTRRRRRCEFADRSMEAVCYYAYWASTELAEERGRYCELQAARCGTGGILPQDSLKLLAEGARRLRRGRPLGHAGLGRALRQKIATARHAQLELRGDRADGDDLEHHRRVGACIEPTFQNLYVKSNLSGEFTVINDYLVRDLKAPGLWDEVMVIGPRSTSTARCRASTAFRRTCGDLRHRVRSRDRSGWWKPRRAARSGSTRLSR